MPKICVCDDEKDIVRALQIYLEAEGYEVVGFHNGQDALDYIQHNPVHCLLLDIMMPIMDGITTLNELRKTIDIPVILISAKSEDADKILGLNCGADDYITKPFNPIEVIARVRSQIRRYTYYQPYKQSHVELNIGDIVVNDSTKSVSVLGESVRLTPIEFSILKLLMSRPGHVFSLQSIFDAIWDETNISAESSIPVHIRHLREKIEIDPANPRYIHVVWGQGYKITEY